ncbi:MAG: hypothetical protein ABIP51_03110 [Bacteroidia bacterium]
MEKQNQPTNLIEYALKSIQVNRYAYTLPKIKIVNVDNILFDYNITPVIRYNIKESLILVFIKSEIVVKETKEKIVDSEFVFVYSTKNLESFMESTPDEQIWKFKDPKNEGLIVTLIGVSLSTTRGMLFEKTRGTIAEGAPLPIMNPQTFIKKAE